MGGTGTLEYTPWASEPDAMQGEIWQIWSWGQVGWGDELAGGLITTLALAGCSLILSLGFGLIAAVIGLYSWGWARLLVRVYSAAFRALPGILILLVIFYAAGTWLRGQLDMQWAGIELSAFISGVIALSLVGTAYAGELFRGTISSIPAGRIDAGKALGMSWMLRAWHIILPELFRLALPGIGNLWQMLLKDTALVSIIGLGDLLRVGGMAARVTHSPFTFYFAVALLYLLLTVVSDWLFSLGEQRLARYDQPPSGA